MTEAYSLPAGWGSRTTSTFLTTLAVLVQAGTAMAGIHTWDVVEAFTNADGTIQYVELLDTGAGGTELGVGNGSLSSSLHSISWSNGQVTGPTNGKSYLIATAAFAALPNAPVPDVIIPAGNVPFFNIAGDAIAFGGFDTLTVTTPPTNGTDSFTRNIGVGPNTPKNYAGIQGNVDAAPPVTPVPSWSGSMLGLLILCMSTVGIIALQKRKVVDAD
jgi:hypothetical protein